MKQKSFDQRGRELKFLTFDRKQAEFEVKTFERDGVRLGTIRGFLATFGNIDRVNDRIEPTAFDETLSRHREQKRMIRMLFQHNRMELIGGFPIDQVEVNKKGLFVTGEINLEVDRGREAFALIKQGALSDMSIGFSIVEFEEEKDGFRILKILELWEGSIVDEPANTEAVITEVKTTPPKNKTQITAADVKRISSRHQFERLLRESEAFTREAATRIASCFDERQSESVVSTEIPSDVLKEMERFTRAINPKK